MQVTKNIFTFTPLLWGVFHTLFYYVHYFFFCKNVDLDLLRFQRSDSEALCFTECFLGAYGLTRMSSHGEILESIKLAH